MPRLPAAFLARHNRSTACIFFVMATSCSEAEPPCEPSLDVELLSPKRKTPLLEGRPLQMEALIDRACMVTPLSNTQVRVTSSIDGEVDGRPEPVEPMLYFTGDSLSPGEHLLTFEVTSEGVTSADSVRVEVEENTPPWVSFMLPTGEEPYVLSPVHMAALTVDYEDEPQQLALRWTLDGDPFDAAADNPGELGEIHFLLHAMPGCHTVQLEVTDTSGDSVTTTMDFLVPDPSTPELTDCL